VGIVLKTLDSLGLAENTIVVFTTDNGGVASGDSYATSNLPLRGGKGYQWEGGIREPLFFRGPGIPAGQTNTTPVTGADLLPTLTALAGITPTISQELDGVDISPVLNGSPLAARHLFWHYPHYGNQGGDPSSIIRQGDWKLIHYWEDGHDELYHLSKDPGERKDLSQQIPERAASMKTTLLDWLESVNAAYPSPDPGLDPAQAQAWAERMRTKKREQLEAERQAMFLPDWEPNPDWWGSLITED
ncbi:MAG: sulfatase-like hydrolase/transferase, partial [Bacteroidota bacterium]